MTNIFQDPFEIQDETSCSLHQLSNYVTDSYIFLSNSDIISWCYLYVFMCFYFWIVYLVFLLYKSEYAFRLYRADDDAGQQYCWSPTDESAEYDNDNEDNEDSNNEELSDKESNDDSKDAKCEYEVEINKCNNLPTILSIAELKALNTKHFEYTISDNAKLIMLYDFDTKSFWYYINQQSLVDFNTLEIIALQYVTKYNCMSLFNASDNVGVMSDGDINKNNKNNKNITKDVKCISEPEPYCESITNISSNVIQMIPPPSLSAEDTSPTPLESTATTTSAATATTTATTVKSSVYASFKKNKRIETSDTDKSSSLYSNHYRYMGKLLDYDELNSYLAVELKYNQSCKQNTTCCLKYDEYKDKIDKDSKEICNTTTDVCDSGSVGVMGCICPKYSVKSMTHVVCQYRSPGAVVEPTVLLDCSTTPTDAIPDHEKVD